MHLFTSDNTFFSLALFTIRSHRLEQEPTSRWFTGTERSIGNVCPIYCVLVFLDLVALFIADLLYIPRDIILSVQEVITHFIC